MKTKRMAMAMMVVAGLCFVSALTITWSRQHQPLPPEDPDILRHVGRKLREQGWVQNSNGNWSLPMDSMQASNGVPKRQ
jgi:hypothetical protein